MSMLTPRGHSYQRRRGQSRAKILSIGFVLVALLAGGAYLLLSLFSPGTQDKSVAAQRCPAAKLLKTGDVHIKIVNSTRTDGLARATAVQFSSRGFKVVSVGNVGGAKNAPATAAPRTTVYYGLAGRQAADLVVTNLKRANPSQDSRAGADVEVVLGKDYAGLRAPGQVLADLAKRPPSTPNCDRLP